MANTKKEILVLVEKYFQENYPKVQYTKGNRINYAGRVFDSKELTNLIESSLDFWLTAGKFVSEFEKMFSKFLNTRYTLLVNSGSSANLLAFFTLTSHLLGDRKIQRGDEVITVAAGFPTTIAPIIQYGAIPVFVDIDLQTYNLDISHIEQALSPKTKAIFVAHTLGNPFDIQTIKFFCQKHNLWLIEDNCDALGSKYQEQYTGTFGDIATSSFYPPHHITMGEGGAVYTNNPLLKKIALSLRDWGRDCWCESGKDNTCGVRFNQQCGKLPFGYDHKYVYSHFGFNLKATEMQAAIGLAQLEKLPFFIKKRQENHQYLQDGMKKFENFFILPQAQQDSSPSWFGFLLTLRKNTPFSRNEIVEFLESKNIQTRNLFAGNILYQPLFSHLQQDQDYRVIGELKNTNIVMNRSFWLGVYPNITREMIEYIIWCFEEFLRKYL